MEEETIKETQPTEKQGELNMRIEIKEASGKSIEEAMKTMTTEKLKQLYDDLGAGEITINQMRAEYGLPPLPGCDELLIIGEHGNR